MAINTGDATLDALLTQHLHDLAAGNDSHGNLLSATTRIPEAAFHDFSYYRFLLPPQLAAATAGGTTAGTGVGLGTSLRFEEFVAFFDATIRACIVDWIQRDGSKMLLGGYSSDRPSWEVSDDDVAIAIEASARDGFREGMAPALFELYVDSPQPAQFRVAAVDAAGDWLETALPGLAGTDDRYERDELFTVRTTSFWEPGIPHVTAVLAAFVAPGQTGQVAAEFGDELPTSYDFEPFRPATVNVGLQVVYRQGWVPLGTQPGEIVRTLPLGPKQSEKITFKVVRRSKATRQVEIATSVETATESSAATKDSSEVMQEASEKFNWHVEASASASWGFGSAEVKAGAGGENASASKDVKSQLNETMEKTASKLRKDTKIIVSTEVEETTELAQASEITNPNDEIAVTYVYSRLQRQYELRTYLSEVNQVVFVAERLPAPDEITGPWIRRYDWIIARELLDESFRADLEVVRDFEIGDHSEHADVDAHIRRLMESISGDGGGAPAGIPDYKTLPGQIPDLFQTQQAAYERELERKRAKDAERERYDRSLRRLRAHIYDNVLHYCRAIWSAEDPDARILRYRRIKVPVTWQFAATGSTPGSLLGYFLPSVSNAQTDTVALSDLVHPAGPIGFAGNYAVYYCRQSTRWSSLTDLLEIMAAPYLSYDVVIDRDGLSRAVGLRAAVSDDITGPSRYRCQVGYSGSGALELSVHELRGSSWVFVTSVSLREGHPVSFAGIRLWVSGTGELVDGDSFEIRLTVLQELEDPELKALRWSLPPLTDAQMPRFFTTTVIGEMREYFTDVFLAYGALAADVSWETSSEAQRALLRSRYYDYLLRKRHTRRILLDTNNLLLTREVDARTTLEPFKGLHRVLDVLKAGEDVREVALENERKRLRLDAARLGDPDVDKLTVVTTVPDAASLAALDNLQEDGSTEHDGDDS